MVQFRFYTSMRYCILLIHLIFSPFPFFAQEGHYSSKPLEWDGEFSDRYSLCVINRDNEISALGNLKNGVPDGAWLFLKEERVIIEKGNYKKGQKHGRWISYDMHGNIESSGMYKKGKMHGLWYFYDKLAYYKRGIKTK